MTASTRKDHVTDSVSAARQDARAQAGSVSDAQVFVPPSTSPHAPHGVAPDSLTWAETVAPGGYAHRIVARGTRIRLEDPDGTACAHVLVFNALEPWERLNIADTQKIPWQAYVTTGHPLLSGEGRALATVVEDTSAAHDAFCGTSTAALNERKYGAHRPESPSPSGRDLFVVAGAKHGLSPRDLPPSISFFQGVRVHESGALRFVGSAGAGAFVDLVAELPLIVLIANVPHPLDPGTTYAVGPLRIHAWTAAPTVPDAATWRVSPEAARAYANTLDYATARGLDR